MFLVAAHVQAVMIYNQQMHLIVRFSGAWQSLADVSLLNGVEELVLPLYSTRTPRAAVQDRAVAWAYEQQPNLPVAREDVLVAGL